ncbi:MAG: serine hydrolase [Steroidobacter sp.]|nr:serine hydrolase [Steroidobacter sp.]
MFLLKQPLADQARVLNDDLIDEMSRDPVATGTGNGGYAVGWGVPRNGDYRVIGHTGSTSGVASNLMFVPSQNLGVVVLANADGGTGSLPAQILKSFLPDWQIPPRPSLPVTPAFQPTVQLIGTWQGKVHTYAGEQPIQLNVLPGGDVHIRIGGEPRYSSSLQQDALLII